MTWLLDRLDFGWLTVAALIIVAFFQRGVIVKQERQLIVCSAYCELSSRGYDCAGGR